MVTKKVTRYPEDQHSASGGVVEEAYWLDNHDNLVDKKKATGFAVRELDEYGSLLRKTWGFLDREAK